MSAFKCLSWTVKQKHRDAQQALLQNEQNKSVSQDLVFMKMFLIRTTYGKGKWIEADVELSPMKTLALIFPPKVETSGWGAT